MTNNHSAGQHNSRPILCAEHFIDPTQAKMFDKGKNYNNDYCYGLFFASLSYDNEGTLFDICPLLPTMRPISQYKKMGKSLCKVQPNNIPTSSLYGHEFFAQILYIQRNVNGLHELHYLTHITNGHCDSQKKITTTQNGMAHIIFTCMGWAHGRALSLFKGWVNGSHNQDLIFIEHGQNPINSRQKNFNGLISQQKALAHILYA